MASPQRQALLLSLCLSAVVASSSSSIISLAPNELVSRICDNTDHPPLCLATILPFLNGGQTDLQSVLKYSIQAGGDYAKEALEAVKNLADSKDSTPEVKATLKDCKNSYSTAVDNYQKAMKAMPANDVGTMRSVLSAVITFISDCEDEFTEMQTSSPMSAYAEKLIDMTSNSLAIVGQLRT